MNIIGFEKILHINNFSIVKSIYQHSVCDFEAIINVDDINEFYNKINTPITVINNDDIVFHGYVFEINIQNCLSKGIINVNARSNSNKLDLNPKNRIFQDPDKTFGDILKSIQDNFTIQTLNNEILNKKIEYPIIQYNETDFQFIVRLAKIMQIYSFLDDTSNNSNIKIILAKMVENSSIKLELSSMNAINKIRKYDYINKKYHNILQITTNQLIRIGSIISIKSDNSLEKYLVTDWQMFKYKEVFLYKYTLYKENDYPTFIDDTNIGMVSFKAKVCNNKDTENLGRIQVEFLDKSFQDCSKNKLWIPFKTPYSANSNGFIFIPDIDNIVEVVFFNDTFIANDCIREQKLTDEFSNIDNKYISNIHNKTISFTDNCLEIKSDNNTINLNKDSITLSVENSKIILNKNSIEIIVNDNKITIDENLTISNKKGNLNVENNSLNVQSNDDIYLISNKNSVTIHGKNEVKIKANSISLD